MSIKSTIRISRQDAINRIKLINKLILQLNYHKIEQESSEDSISIERWVNDYYDVLLSKKQVDVNMYSNSMLADIMDLPFYRTSIFNNYIIEN
jgi:hypothetical protein